MGTSTPTSQNIMSVIGVCYYYRKPYIRVVTSTRWSIFRDEPDSQLEVCHTLQYGCQKLGSKTSQQLFEIEPKLTLF